MTGHRAERVADRIRRVLAPLIQEELRDPRLGFLTLTEVRLSPDLRHARAFVTVMPGERRQPTLDALNHAVPFLRRALARRAGLRFTPQLIFLCDDVADAGRSMDRILDAIREERGDGRDEA